MEIADITPNIMIKYLSSLNIKYTPGANFLKSSTEQNIEKCYAYLN
jgi:hypothetical protein